ncbi:hypothetical protein [Leclercia sp. UBA7405]|uniref:hypothetical protein n=1 Tax=Leclercia sp. UBA7405 TaxID=1946743 RepID=UPI0030165E0B
MRVLRIPAEPGNVLRLAFRVAQDNLPVADGGAGGAAAFAAGMPMLPPCQINAPHYQHHKEKEG